MPLDPLQFVAHFESSGNPIAQNAKSSSSGLTGFLDSTWQQWAQQVPGASQYDHAADAPASVQAAVFAADYNAQAFKDWTCAGCDAPLTAALANAGGPSAFAPPGTLSTNPASYAALNSGFNAYFASNAVASDPLNATGSVYGTTDASVNPGYDQSLTPGSITNNINQTVSSITEAAPFAPFSWVIRQYDTAIQQPLDQKTQQVVDKAGGIAGSLVIIAIACAGIAVALRIKGHHALVTKFIKAATVVASLSAGGLYQTLLVPIVKAIPDWISGDGNALAKLQVATPFDQAIFQFIAMSSKAMAAAHGPTSIAIVLALIVIAGIFLLPALALMFGIFFAALIVTGLLLVLGAVLLLTLLSEYTENIFFKLIHHFIGLAMLAFASIVIASLAVNLVNGVFDAVPQATTSAALGSNLVAAVVAVLAVAFSLAVLWKMIGDITGNASAPHVAHSAQSNIGRAASNIINAPTSMSNSVSNVVAMRRPSTPAGRMIQ
jgi:hypothetical protein